MTIDWSEAAVLITGGTGSFGRTMSDVLLNEYHPRKLIIFSRDELKQHEMRAAGYDDSVHPAIRYFIGDVRDQARLRRAMADVDVVIHAAALKQVPACEYNPIEAVLTNVMGTRNVIEAAIDSDVKKVMAISTDKAVNPVNIYGATKLTAEKLIVQANAYSPRGGTSFACARYGNVVGSRGSVIPMFLEQRRTGRLTVTDERMTRFWITIEQGARFVVRCLTEMHGGEVFVPKLPSMNIMELARAIGPDCEIDHVGIRPGEKLHEILVNRDEARQAVELEDMFVIQPAHPWWNYEHWEHGTQLPPDFHYTSDENPQWLGENELKELVDRVGRRVVPS